MSRRAPPPEYYEEEESEFERERHPRSRRGDRDIEDDMGYHRRRSIPPVEEDLERLRLRERPPRDFVRDEFVPMREKASRRSREELDANVPGSEAEEIYMRQRPRRRTHLSREAEEDMLLNEQERRSSHRSRPRELDEEELIVHDRKLRGGRKHRPREIDEEELIFEREHRLPPRRRSREVEDEELRADEREHRGSRKQRPREIDEEEAIFEREHRLPPRRRSREVEDEDPIIDERDHRGSRKHRPREFDEEEVILEERDRRGARRLRPRELDEEELVVEERKRRGGRKYRPPEIDLIEEEDLIIDDRDRRRRHRADRDIEEEMAIPREGRYPPRPYDSEGDLRLREMRFEDERGDMYIPPRRRPRHREPELDEVMIDERERDSRSGKSRQERRQERRSKEEVVMRWKDRPAPHELDEDEELYMHKMHRQRRRSHPEPEYTREPRNDWPDHTEDVRIRSRTRPRPRHLETEDDEDVLIHRGEPEQDLHSESADNEEILPYKEKRKSSPRERSPFVEPVHAPPIHQDVFTHHRHIDHGFEQPPRAPSPEMSSTTTSFDDVDVHRRTKNNRELDEDQSDDDGDESISPTSRPSINFDDPWKGDKTSVRDKSKSLNDEADSLRAASAHIRRKKGIPREVDLDDKFSLHEKISLAGDSPKDTTDEWSVVRAPSKTEALEMTGALDIVEVAPKGSSEPEIEVEEEESQTRPKLSKDSKEQRDERWTEITKDLVVREAIEQLGYEFEETRMFYYIFSYLGSTEIDELVELSDEIRRGRRRRIREMHRERSSIPARPASLFDAVPPRPHMPIRPRMPVDRRMMERERLLHGRR